jgi:hypothetical protein
MEEKWELTVESLPSGCRLNELVMDTPTCEQTSTRKDTKRKALHQPGIEPRGNCLEGI